MTLRTAALAALALLAAAQPAAAAEDTRRLGKFGEWEAYVYGDGAAKVCYAAAWAARIQGGEKGHNATAVIVTHRPTAKSAGEVSVNGGYGFKKDSDVELQVGATKHALFTRGDRAWTKDVAADKAIVGAMIKAKDMSLRATPAKGQPVGASIPLSGFGEALAAIDKACGVKR